MNEPNYGGMTVNERLVMAGKMDKWDEAVSRRDRRKMIRVLKSVQMTSKQAEETTDAVLGNPGYYGFNR